MTSVAVVSSLYGNIDQPMSPAWQDLPADWILVSDRQHDCWPWKVCVEPRPQLHPRLAAKVAKCRPDRYSNADVLIWLDASIKPLGADFLNWCLTGLGSGDLAQIPHPNRQALTPEAALSATLEKYAGLPVREQVNHYLLDGFIDIGLWATGLIVYRNGPWLQRFGDAWLAEQVRWTYQDQLSEPYVLWQQGIRPVDLPGGLLENRRFVLTPHNHDR